MLKRIRIALLLASSLSLNPALLGNPPSITTEEHFHDMFLTAGYSTVFGAALGAAFLGLTENPSENFQFVAMGASLGFIGGSLLGTYLVFNPTFIVDSNSFSPSSPNKKITLAAQQPAANSIQISPIWNTGARKWEGISASLSLYNF